MKINVIKNSAGKVVGTFENAVGNGPSVTPVLRDGHTVHEIEVEEDYKKDIKAFYEKHG